MAKNATQGTETFRGGVAARAVDGDHDPDIRNPYCAQAIDGRVACVNVWWEVDLGATYVVLGVNITNLDESECGSACPGWSSTFLRRRRRATPHFFSTSCYLIRMT